ncbi:MAG: type I-F CRISPR-associated protein Csy2 [Rhodanobacteraceae bacterium]|nr:type I-F CRISPR-associated protein Csy2 [Rhodanobacteraceae bacterium]
MNTCPAFDHFIVLPRLRVQNANAVSSPLTHGFPSMTAFLGLMWALQRKTHQLGLDLSFDAVGVICHGHEEQVNHDGFVHTFRLTRNPVDKDGSTAAIVEEGRIHLEISLVFAVSSQHWYREPDARETDVATVAALVAGLRVAGGSVLPPAQPAWARYRPYLVDLSGSEEDRLRTFARARLRWLPGYALVARDDLLQARAAAAPTVGGASARLDAWLSFARINWSYRPAAGESTAGAGRGEWINDKRGAGWIVPIPVGYGALGPLQPAGQVANARDATTDFRFVESVYSVGEWLSPHRLKSPEQLLWYADSRPQDGAYRCRNDYQPPDTAAPIAESD